MALNSVAEPGLLHSEDFQQTPDGGVAAFRSAMPVAGFDNAARYELLRFDAGSGDDPICISCSPTGATPTSDAALASAGGSLTDDGRVFFNTGEPLVLRDGNARRDAYEWSGGRAELISTGQSGFDSSLLSVSADGTDAFFFTREKLAENDGNGNLMRIYDARENGGFFAVPPIPQCAASDECHGAGSPTPPPPSINTVTRTAGNVPPTGRKRCPKGRKRVERKGKVRCAKRRRPRERGRGRR
jgi:hypothetical protein